MRASCDVCFLLPENKLLLLDQTYWREYFKDFTGHRAIGVIDHPENERGNYVPTQLALRYDALLYIDSSKVLHPLHLQAQGHEVPETYPFGF
jgi:erythromycin esterase